MALKNRASNVKFPSWLPCRLVWNLTFWTHASLPWRCMKANPRKFRQALIYSWISLCLINFSHNAQEFPELHKRFQSAGAVWLRHCFERWELLIWYLIVFSYADGFSFNLCSLEAQKIPCSLLPKDLLLHCWGISLYYVYGIFYTWSPDDVIKQSHICFLWNYFTNLIFDFSHIISQKHSIDYNLSQHKCQCCMFVLLKWAVAVEKVEKEREIIITAAQMALYCVVPTTFNTQFYPLLVTRSGNDW